jgi:IS30 family transposase
MEAIKAIAKRTKTGKYKIDLPITDIEDEVEVMVVLVQNKVKTKKISSDFAGKMNSGIDWLAYQKEVRNEW